MKVHSIRKRFIFTAFANLIRSIITFFTGILLARWLGVDSYGNMAFLLGTFLAVRQLFDMGSSSAFFTFMSQRAQSKRFVWSFFVWLSLQLFVPFIIILLLFPSHWIERIWHGEQRGLILLALIAVFMQHSVWPAVQQACESQRQTILSQKLSVIVIIFHFVAVVLLWLVGELGLHVLFVAISLEYMVATYFVHRNFCYTDSLELDKNYQSFKIVFSKYLKYCLPLIPFSWVGFLYLFVDRWLLQKYGGPIEQAYYSVAALFATVSLLATSSILRIFWKEIAEASEQNNHPRSRELYWKVSRILFLIGAIIAGFLIPWAEDILKIMLGGEYVGGAISLMIMFLYPVHQSMGQIGGTMLLATERVSIQVTTGIIFMLLSMVVTYLMLAPNDAIIPGLGMASEGLAIKMLLMQFIQVNVVAFIIARTWNWPFDWVYQPVSLLSCVGLGWLVWFVTTSLIFEDVSFYIEIVVAGVMYLLSIVVLVFCLPWLAGLTRNQLILEVSMIGHGKLRFTRFKPKA